MATKKKKQVTSENFGDLLVESANQALEYTTGDIDLRESVARLLPAPPQYGPKDIKGLRERFHLTQDLLAQLLGVKSSAVKHWEQGLRSPSSSACRLLQIIEADPDILKKIA